MLNTLETIQEVIKVYDTGAKPFLVICNDFEYWVCKHDRDRRKLAKEIIASEYAKLWSLNVPEVALIKFDFENHLPKGQSLWSPGMSSFNSPCFGSKLLENVMDLNDTFAQLFTKGKHALINKNHFLRIALFDIWLANDDRNWGNNNLLLQQSEESSRIIYLIDHSEIFNGNFLVDYPIYEIDDQSSILSASYIKSIFPSKSPRQKEAIIDLMEREIKNFYICVEVCQRNSINIINSLPREWNIDVANFSSALRNNLYTSDWLQKCESIFRQHVQHLIIAS